MHDEVWKVVDRSRVGWITITMRILRQPLFFEKKINMFKQRIWRLKNITSPSPNSLYKEFLCSKIGSTKIWVVMMPIHVDYIVIARKHLYELSLTRLHWYFCGDRTNGQNIAYSTKFKYLWTLWYVNSYIFH